MKLWLSPNLSKRCNIRCKLQTVFFKIAKYIYPNCKMYFSKSKMYLSKLKTMYLSKQTLLDLWRPHNLSNISDVIWDSSWNFSFKPIICWSEIKHEGFDHKSWKLETQCPHTATLKSIVRTVPPSPHALVSEFSVANFPGNSFPKRRKKLK